jgi:hypothetical protein
LLAEAKAVSFAAWKFVDLWKEQGREFIPLIKGKLSGNGEGIAGAASLGAELNPQPSPPP